MDLGFIGLGDIGEPCARHLGAARIGENPSRRGGVIPALVRCAHGPLGPRPRPYGPGSLTYPRGLLVEAGHRVPAPARSEAGIDRAAAVV